MRTRFLVLAGWTLLVVILLIIPMGGEMPGPDIPHIDKLAHFGMFFVTGFISAYTFGFLSRLAQRLAAGLAFGVVLALGTEIGQSFLPYRTADIFDLLADITGVVFGLFAFTLLYAWKQRI